MPTLCFSFLSYSVLTLIPLLPEFGEEVAESSDSSAARAPVRLILRGSWGSLGRKGKGGKEEKGKCWAFPSAGEFMLWSADPPSFPIPPSLVPASKRDILEEKSCRVKDERGRWW